MTPANRCQQRRRLWRDADKSRFSPSCDRFCVRKWQIASQIIEEEGKKKINGLDRSVRWWGEPRFRANHRKPWCSAKYTCRNISRSKHCQQAKILTWVYYSLIDKVRTKKDSHFVESVRGIWKKVKTTSFVSVCFFSNSFQSSMEILRGRRSTEA